PGPGEPPQPAPGDRSVRDTRKARCRSLRFRLACGMSFGRLVKDHHRTTERYAPQPACVSLAELRDFLEPSLGELWLDLCIRGRCGAKQHEQRQSVEMVPDPHPLPPCRSLAQTLGANYASFQFKAGLTLDQRCSVYRPR